MKYISIRAWNKDKEAIVNIDEIVCITDISYDSSQEFNSILYFTKCLDYQNALKSTEKIDEIKKKIEDARGDIKIDPSVYIDKIPLEDIKKAKKAWDRIEKIKKGKI